MTYENYVQFRRDCAIEINAYVQSQKKMGRNQLLDPILLTEGEAQQRRNSLCQQYPEFTVQYYRELANRH
jgi:hypothetical protein